MSIGVDMLKYELDLSKGTYIMGSFFFPNWPACDRAKVLLKEKGMQYTYIQADKRLFGKLIAATKSQTVPQIFIDGEFIGGYDDLVEYFDNNSEEK